jgi:hypothetical protein
MSHKISFSKLDQLAEFSNAFPRCMEQLARKRVQNYVDASSCRFSHQAWKEGLVAGVEDMILLNAKIVD